VGIPFLIFIIHDHFFFHAIHGASSEEKECQGTRCPQPAAWDFREHGGALVIFEWTFQAIKKFDKHFQVSYFDKWAL